MGPAEKDTAVGSGPAADHRRLARRPVLNDPIQLIGPASLVGNSRETFHKSGTDGSNPVPSCGESYKLDHGGRSRRPTKVSASHQDWVDAGIFLSIGARHGRKSKAAKSPLVLAGRGHLSDSPAIR